LSFANHEKVFRADMRDESSIVSHDLVIYSLYLYVSVRAGTSSSTTFLGICEKMRDGATLLLKSFQNALYQFCKLKLIDRFHATR